MAKTSVTSNLKDKMKETVKRIVDVVWEFCSFVFVPQRRPKSTNGSWFTD